MEATSNGAPKHYDVTALELSVRLANALHQIGVKNTADLTFERLIQFRRSNNVGRATERELAELFDELGLEWPEKRRPRFLRGPWQSTPASDPPLDALQKVIEALAPLGKEQRARILRAAHAFCLGD